METEREIEREWKRKTISRWRKAGWWKRERERIEEVGHRQLKSNYYTPKNVSAVTLSGRYTLLLLKLASSPRTPSSLWLSSLIKLVSHFPCPSRSFPLTTLYCYIVIATLTDSDESMWLFGSRPSSAASDEVNTRLGDRLVIEFVPCSISVLMLMLLPTSCNSVKLLTFVSTGFFKASLDLHEFSCAGAIKYYSDQNYNYELKFMQIPEYKFMT